MSFNTIQPTLSLYSICRLIFCKSTPSKPLSNFEVKTLFQKPSRWIYEISSLACSEGKRQ
ncbi:CLUMA_CG010484, isoform A [Clunio marinus]|uniref:CLUMA_CG010484, isoform A n=1 Tax=Clunio marinus TaxID=568069 RepID=A0A1J1IDJ8_9DIPT|nr:CLUMA_CG010484, isoform A [Clunio marinus]